MPVATASGGGVANLSHDLFFYFIVFYKKKICMQRNRFYNGIVSEIKLYFNNTTAQLYLFNIISVTSAWANK